MRRLPRLIIPTGRHALLPWGNHDDQLNTQEILRTEGLKSIFPRRQSVRTTLISDCAAAKLMALLGENGRENPTLIKALTGVYHADRGTIWLEGQAISPKNTPPMHNNSVSANCLSGSKPATQYVGR